MAAAAWRALAVAAVMVAVVTMPVTATYTLTDIVSTDEGLTGRLVLQSGSLPEYGEDLKDLRFRLYYESPQHLRVRITDMAESRWEVPHVLQANRIVDHDIDERLYTFSYTTNPFRFTVTRRSDGERLLDFDTLIFKDQYVRFATRLPSAEPNIYGLGERVWDFRLDPHNRTYTIFSADSGTPDFINLYGAQPFYLDHRSNGNSHGVLFLNSNGMDVTISSYPESGTGALDFVAIGGMIDLFVVAGPSVDNVVQQYTRIVGRPYMMPYWVLGFHHCRWGYANQNEVEAVVNGYQAAGIPLDTMWTDIDYMQRNLDFTFDPVNYPRTQVETFARRLHDEGMHYMLILDPAIGSLYKDYQPYLNGLEMNVYMRDAETGEPFVGVVWPGPTVYPDWLHPNTTTWWRNEIIKWIGNLELDGLWIDMNEPSNFWFPDVKPNGTQPDYNHPPYAINNHGEHAALNRKTVRMDALHYPNVPHYNVHNIYGHLESIVTTQTMEEHLGTRTLVLSRSTFPGTGHHAGHWLGDNSATWDDLRFSISGMLSFSLFGIPLNGADICGFAIDTTEELCLRWMQLGAFYPFARNHNAKGFIPQEPYLWESVTIASRNALAVRYALLPYYYTLFYRAHVDGTTVARALFFEFPAYPHAADLRLYDRQFLIGPAILISPVLEAGARTVTAYLPMASRWYDWYTRREQLAGQQVLPAGLDTINVHVRGGHVIVHQDAAMTTTEARQTPFTILVALDANSAAKGEIYLDDGISLDSVSAGKNTLVQFNAVDEVVGGRLTSTVVRANYVPDARIEKIEVLGLDVPTIATVTVNGNYVSFLYENGYLTIADITVPITSPLTVVWA